jgi:two-component system sensor histidine kinase DegS
MAQDIGVLELVTMHHDVLATISARADTPAIRERALRMGGQFLLDVLSPYEMRQRAYGDAVAAVAALRQWNEVLEQEVKRIAHVVHDEAAQLLVAAHLAIADVMHESKPETQKGLLEVNRFLDQAGSHLRQLSHELRPTVLDDLGLAPGIRHLADSVSRRTRISISVKSSVRARLQPAVEVGLYRVVQEALANVTKHSRARKVKIEIKRKGNGIVCAVSDDGVGFDPAALSSKNGSKGLGLVGMRERLKGLRGTLQIRSQPGHGSRLQFAVPLED